jgi:hypothetical protein
MHEDQNFLVDEPDENSNSWMDPSEFGEYIEDVLGAAYRIPRRVSETSVPKTPFGDVFDGWDQDPEDDLQIQSASQKELLQHVSLELLENLNAGLIPFKTSKDFSDFCEDSDKWSQFVKPGECQLPSEILLGKIVLKLGPEKIVLLLNGEVWSYASTESGGQPAPRVASAQSINQPQVTGVSPHPNTVKDSNPPLANLNTTDSLIENFLQNEIGLLFRIGFTIRDLMEEFDSLSEAVSIQNHLILYVTRFEKKPETYIKSSDFESFRQFAKWVYIGAALPDPMRLNWFVHCRRSVVVTTLEELGFNFDQVIEAMWNKHCSGIRL